MRPGLELCGHSLKCNRGNTKNRLDNQTDAMTRDNQSMRISVRWVLTLLCSVVSWHACAQAAGPPAASSGAMPQPVVQANGDVVVMPQSLPISRRFGMRLEVDTRWANAY